MIELKSSRKHKLVLIGSVVALFAVMYLVSHFLLNRTLTDRTPTLSLGPDAMVSTYVWKGKNISYPGTFILREIPAMNDDISKGITKGDPIGFTLTLRDATTPDDFVGVAGEKATCAELAVTLCIGRNPVYTNSKNASVILMYNSLVKTLEQ